jgi:hypothetical protein
MTKVWRIVVAVMALSMLVAGMSGCKKKEGPAERAGREIDKAAEKTGQGIGNAVDKAGEKMEQAGEKIKDAVKK